MAKEFKGIRMRELTKLNEYGELEKFFRYEAVTIKGTRFTVDIPESQATPEAAEKILTDKAKALDAMLGL